MVISETFNHNWKISVNIDGNNEKNKMEQKVLGIKFLSFILFFLSLICFYLLKVTLQVSVKKASHKLHTLASIVNYIELSKKGRNIRLQMLFKIGVLKHFANFTEKHLRWSLFLIKFHVQRPAALLKRDSNTGVFPWNLRNF